MDAILLAGGYATRLYPLTLNRPKALLQVGGRPILDHLVDVLDACAEITRMFLVTNSKFAVHFSDWAAARSLRKPLTMVDDGTTSNEARLGAVGDVQFVLDHADVHTKDGLYVLGTDNLARFDITEIIRLARSRKADTIFACHTKDQDRLRRMGGAIVDVTGRVIDFEEKPQNPKSDLSVPPFYAYTAQSVGLIGRYLKEGNNPDAPGHLVAWMIRQRPVYARVVPEPTYDTGTVESYEEVCRTFGDRS